MKLEWLILGVAAFAIVAVFVFTLLKIASDSDRKARRTEKKLSPHSDVTVTRSGSDK